MRKFQLSIIIPIYNEENVVERSVKRLMDILGNKYKKYEIILGDNGSTDSTPQKCRMLAKKFKRIRFIRLEEKGLGLALKEMIRRARFENIVFLPIDFSVDVKFVDEALPLLNTYDVVIGSKRVEGAVDDRPLPRRVYSFFFNSAINVVFGLGIKDTQCVKAFRKSKVKKISEAVKSKDIYFDVEFLMRAKKAGLKMIEVPIVCRDHRKSKINILREFFRIIFRIVELYR